MGHAGARGARSCTACVPGDGVKGRPVGAETSSHPDELWQPLQPRESLTQRIVAAIEDLMERERLNVGDRLPPERALAALLGVSRPALREAVKVLEARGRLTVRHGIGVFVSASRGDEFALGFSQVPVSIAELFAMREVLEEPAAAWAATAATADDVARLRAALDAVGEARQPAIDYQRLAKLDAEFHMLIVDVAKNRFLRQTLDVLQRLLATSMETTLTVPGRLPRSEREHHAIFEAIARGDALAARRAARRHIRGARDAALSRLAGAEAASPEL